ncbi:MAG TPA: hypothetical protein VFV50_18420 [Bdellovibrionales bacterium]|nr:hypothetical protein [Bdellovibrionales bacterium]
MRKILFMITLLANFAVPPRAFGEASLMQVHFIEMKSHSEKSGLPPKLFAKFDIDCNQKFLKVLRYEVTDPKTKTTRIFVGGLVEDSLLSSCRSQFREEEHAAGTTFSGRSYEVLKIKAP